MDLVDIITLLKKLKILKWVGEGEGKREEGDL
jgi:hypothetical protein